MSEPEPTPPIENLRSTPGEKTGGPSDPTKQAADAVAAGDVALKKCGGLCKKDEKADAEDKYGPEAIRRDIEFQSALIRAWAKERGFVEGKDYRILNFKDVMGDEASAAPHELKEFFMIIHESKYGDFRKYFTGRYREEMKQRDPKNNAQLLYSWAGRFCIMDAGVFLETAPASNVEKMTASLHHKEFKEFFRQRTGVDFPTAEILNPQLQEMSAKGLDSYKMALTKLLEMKGAKTLPNDGYGLIDAMVHAVELLKSAKTGKAVAELPEVITGGMPRDMRTYADLTYNASTVPNLDRVAEITGVIIPYEARTDKIFDRIGFDRNKMQEVCKAFSDYIFTKK